MKGILAVLALLASWGTQASVIYTWIGQCNVSCVGVATATLIIKDGYVPGTPLLLGLDPDLPLHKLEFFSYQDSEESIVLPALHHLLVEMRGGGLLPASGSDGFLELRTGADAGFHTEPGFWAWGFFHRTSLGTHNAWTLVSVPAPATLALLGVGLIGLVFSTRFRMK